MQLVIFIIVVLIPIKKITTGQVTRLWITSWVIYSFFMKTDIKWLY